jgi:hypothetical protein
VMPKCTPYTSTAVPTRSPMSSYSCNQDGVVTWMLVVMSLSRASMFRIWQEHIPRGF